MNIDTFPSFSGTHCEKYMFLANEGALVVMVYNIAKYEKFPS